jgi:type IV pilus assembly protein PilO
MAFEAIDNVPIWQRFALFVLVAALIGAGWYFFFWVDAMTAREAADTSLVKAEAELDRVKAKAANFEEEKKKLEEAEKKLEAQTAVLPRSASTVDSLMQTFQQQARMVGLTVESWQNEPEQREDFYARLPVHVKATGTWSQTGEFLRRVSELTASEKAPIVSVHDFSLKARERRDKDDTATNPTLDIEFEAATYRFLDEKERTQQVDKSSKRTKTRKGGK